MARTLVTGATGFIGRHVVRELASAGHEVRVLVRPTSNLSVFDGLEVRTVLGDILDPESYREHVGQVDHVIHLASLLKMPWSREFAAVHIEGTSRLAAACAAAHAPPMLLVVSSLAALGPSHSVDAPGETRPAAPVSVYGHAKREAELRAASFCDRLPLTVIRPPAVYGPWDRTLLKLFRSVGRGLHVAPGNADLQISLVQVEDLAAGIVTAALRGERMESTSDTPGSGVYHLAGDERPTYGTLGSLVAAAMEVPSPRLVKLPKPVARGAAVISETLARVRDRPTVLSRDKIREALAGHWICSNEKARRDLGWRPGNDLESRLKETALWYREHGWL